MKKQRVIKQKNVIQKFMERLVTKKRKQEEIDAEKRFLEYLFAFVGKNKDKKKDEQKD